MAFLCMDCGEVYDNEYRNVEGYWDDYRCAHIKSCVKSSCNGEVVEIDEVILPTIIKLKELGYYTNHCCGGHYKSEIPDIYISISAYEDDDFYAYKKFSELEHMLKNIGFVIEDIDYDREKFCIRKEVGSLCFADKNTEYISMLKSNIDLYNIINIYLEKA